MPTVLEYLEALGPQEIVALLLPALIVDFPRYVIGFLAIAMTEARLGPRKGSSRPPSTAKVSVLLAGHNEASSVARCVRSLRRQQLAGGVEIVCVDDGSTDSTYAIMRRLEADGLVDRAVRLGLRGGKSAAVNLAAALATGDILVVADCDAEFDGNALRELLAPFEEGAHVAAVSGNILVRNQDESAIATCQGIEYLISISLGRILAGVFDQVTCVSGAFGAFRRSAWEAVGGQDVGPGEDLDLTLRLRARGYAIRFAPAAVCYTDVPADLRALARQRVRWERDAFWLRFRKHGYMLNPLDERFRMKELVGQVEFIIFTLLPSFVFPAYLLYLSMAYAPIVTLLLAAVWTVLMVVDLISLALAAYITKRRDFWQLLAFLPLHTLLQSYFMRFLRLYIFTDELIFSRSIEDNYVPEKVRAWSEWR